MLKSFILFFDIFSLCQKDLGCQDCLIEDIGNVNQIGFNNPVDSLGVGNVNIPDLGMPGERSSRKIGV